MNVSTLHREPAAPRILLHSHDSYGLGHLRRTLTIAGALAARIPGAQIMICGLKLLKMPDRIVRRIESRLVIPARSERACNSP